MYWVGMDTDPRTTPEALAAFNDFYNATHVHEVIAAHPGFISVSRYELLDPDERGGHHAGPRWLAAYEMVDEAAAERYVKDSARPWLHRRAYSPWPAARKRAKMPWRMLWRQVAATGRAEQPPASVYIVGMNVPDPTSDSALAEFNAFYTHIHVPEIIAAGGYSRATRWELYREYAHPAPGAPRFCAIYEADSTATDQRDARRAVRGPLTAGPPAWEQRDTLWRLVYRRIPVSE
ncbi:MAG: hypothetical protein NVSMB2_15680 [Chloroflexota bacterium]